MIHRIKPVFKDYIWGGTRLREDYGKISDLPVIAESWELSTHKDGESLLEESGQTLSVYLEANPKALGDYAQHYDRFPILIKLIDAKSNLSVQVHPSDEYAHIHEGDNGKTEMWYIVDAEEDSFIYYGFKEDMDAETFATAIADNTIEERLHKQPVRAGESYFIPAGTIHAIGAGCLIAEVQQNSNVTYRVYDYDRRDAEGNPRELHVEKAKLVTKLEKQNLDITFEPHLAVSEYFVVDLLEIDGEKELDINQDTFYHILCLEGNLRLQAEAEDEVFLAKGEGAFIDAATGTVCLKGEAKCLVTYLPSANQY